VREPAAARNDTPREREPEPVEPAKPAGPPPVPELRTPETADDQQASRQVRETLERARGLLQQVDYRRLGQEARAQYDTAKQFMDHAEEALRVRNYVAARYLADKADTIARQLSGR
ncbi:MAG TPA: hypothetical protein VNI83_14925, partial [Vicinamibacterales bacterium]|nr:hypothetical protein [Vicinamibacterales bacterium]